MSRLYLDTSTIIYLLEAVSPFHEAAVTAIQRHCGLSTGARTEILTSRLSRMECRVKPLRQGDQTLLEKYDAFFSQRGLILAEISAAVIEQATEIRVRYRFKTPDAIHVVWGDSESDFRDFEPGRPRGGSRGLLGQHSLDGCMLCNYCLHWRARQTYT